MGKRIVAMVLVALGMFAATVEARAQNVEAGKQMAETWCSSCHLVDLSQRKAPNDMIPSFAAIAQMKSTTRESLAAFLTAPHPPMPNFALSRREIADLSAYILSLQKTK